MDLIGTGTLERASIEQWLLTEEESFDPLASGLVFHLAFAPLFGGGGGQVRDEKVVEESKKKLAGILDIYERRLKKTQFLAGEKFTLADLSHLPNARYPLSTECAPLFSSRKRVRKWWEDISSRSSWRRVVAMQQELPTCRLVPH